MSGISSGARRGLRLLAASVVLLTPSLVTVPSAAAQQPPKVNPKQLNLNPPDRAPDPTEQKLVCGKPFASSAATLRDPSDAQQLLEIDQLHSFATGAGQRVAVIDTGVKPSSRFGRVLPGGDLVSSSNGLDDCDGHGTIVAGIIAAKARPNSDGFVGVAPGATLISIRQTSLSFAAKNSARNESPAPIADTSYGNVLTLAWAVVKAVKAGADVINISEVACAPAGTAMGDGQLGAALRYAHSRNVVVVAAAGNLEGNCKQQNPYPTFANPDTAGWDNLQTIVSPAWYDDYVLTVGGVDSKEGQPAPFSVHGPWVDVAGPATDIVSVGTDGSAVNRQQGKDGPISIDGTSFSTPYVAGLAALIKQRYPGISADDVVKRIIGTAHGPGAVRDPAVGYGVVDPLAALTTPMSAITTPAERNTAVSMPRPAPVRDGYETTRKVALAGAGGSLAVALAYWLLTMPRRRLRALTEDDY
ncbi:putative peptidase S8 family protein [Gordonia araii NBRC 100433]|uniref:Putative peptidase S8 family protein n=1 Tax=Gordonia araii NBRC 100433 TaxID=1073574 RepID=G7H7S8_9ACTN|nr:type VII secretion-associated serine protease mycosin [Gordonia araii]NNG95656.1 type VII secretion-associated serine protease mycosin [Gordonia araii NBRC 100433]GAB11903.1 putative peptidase S8 family protein [Gordonia araii NBRC 100433]